MLVDRGLRGRADPQPGLPRPRAAGEPAARDPRDWSRRSSPPRRAMSAEEGTWAQTACILCECNCGIEVQLDGRTPRAHPRRQGPPRPRRATPATRRCASTTTRTAAHRLTSPLRRRRRRQLRGDRLGHRDRRDRRAASSAIRDEHGGESIFYYGGGGQGNHLGGAYSGAFLRALGVALPLQRARAGEDRRGLGRRTPLRRPHPRRLRARRGLGLRRQEPVAVAELPARPRRAAARSPRTPSAR